MSEPAIKPLNYREPFLSGKRLAMDLVFMPWCQNSNDCDYGKIIMSKHVSTEVNILSEIREVINDMKNGIVIGNPVDGQSNRLDEYLAVSIIADLVNRERTPLLRDYKRAKDPREKRIPSISPV
jgi:hypothetical protein